MSDTVKTPGAAPTMPAFFFGHGNPMNAVQSNPYTQAWAAIGRNLPRPRAILVVSAHWYLPGTWVTAMPAPRTIHDFGGFPRELYEVLYPAPGSPSFAREVQEMLAPTPVRLDEGEWGLDHGTWSVLRHVFPDASIPVVQLGIDKTRTGPVHYALGQKLTALRDAGVLVVGSGNLVHNLHAYAWGRHPVEPFDWALRFEARARALLVAADHAPLAEYESLGRDAMLAVPTPEHYLPLLYVIGTRRPGEPVSFPVEGIDGGSVSMLTVRIG
jgi:4,5-DOPA dioxygenase extradiol